ncbi:conserved protein of unknown function [Candidatus Methylomirabilis oxygeniifera]|uniref:Uncharacterized protein n=1 Tax=Methylomirabilis oxygeniifera TaxID=671143 RepID=D5MHL6_METO1|nr:conserved protein of unknown function [Candidatus Methylomirabilis oxyfera]
MQPTVLPYAAKHADLPAKPVVVDARLARPARRLNAHDSQQPASCPDRCVMGRGRRPR